MKTLRYRHFPVSLVLLILITLTACERPTPPETPTPPVTDTKPADPPATDPPNPDQDKDTTDTDSGLKTTPDTPAEARRKRLEAKAPVIMSYYWPITRESRDLRKLTMDSPNFIDIQPPPNHGSESDRNYWRENGKTLLSRVYPFQKSWETDYLLEDLANNMSVGDGISIDELHIEHLRAEKRPVLINAIKTTRERFPDKFIFVWDVSAWSEETAPYLRSLAESADAISLEIYIAQKEARESGITRLATKLATVEALAPGISKKIIIGIGAYPDTRDTPESDLTALLEQQVQYIGCDKSFDEILGVAIYAPIYLRLEEHQSLDKALKKYILTPKDQRECEAPEEKESS